ncbi:hypothetical protein LOK49_LG02G01415 [Camellia lanceoleosa]|uniref:Uncharacterized protein n=1 Tax=Camellia lanceoleosa TaxID=1840588 RepID=A0ACC0IQE6_9ERIC|nr:hypothetical protein LOK49_LG02G01415 [Camellia lanceoleosa]
MPSTRSPYDRCAVFKSPKFFRINCVLSLLSKSSGPVGRLLSICTERWSSDILMKIILSGLNGDNVQEQQHLKHVPSSTPPTMGEHLEPNSQMELVGHLDCVDIISISRPTL